MKQLHSLDYSEEPSSSDTSTADASAYALVAVGSNINRPVIPTLKPGQQQNSGAVDEWVPRTLACTQDTCGAAAVLSLTVALAAVQPDGVPDSLLRLISPFRLAFISKLVVFAGRMCGSGLCPVSYTIQPST